MAKSLNKATLIGHAGKDAEVRYTGNGKPVASFTIATNYSIKDASGQFQEKTDWHNIVAWERLAEVCGQYVKKGTRLYVEGPIQTRSWDDKDGNKRYTTEITAREMILLDGQGGGRSSEGGNQGSYRAPVIQSQSMPSQPDYEPQSAPVDDLPF